MNYPQLQYQEFQKNPNRLDDKPRGNETVYEASQPEPSPSIASILDVESLLADPLTLEKVEAVDTFIEQQARKEGLREGAEGYRTILQRLISRMPYEFEVAVRGGKAMEVLNFLVGEISLENKLSTDTYLKNMAEKINMHKASKALDQLRVIWRHYQNKGDLKLKRLNVL